MSGTGFSRGTLSHAAVHVPLLMTAMVTLTPFVWMLSLSAKPMTEISQANLALFPSHWSLYENYMRALTDAPLVRYMLNGAFICGMVLLFQFVICAPAAYALAKIRFPGQSLLFGLVLVGLLIPHEVLALPLFIGCFKLGLLDTYAALIVPFVVSPFGIFLLRQFMMSIPNDIIHAARLDGLSEWAIIWRIVMPMARPAVIAFSIISIVARWNDLFWPTIAITSDNLMPPSLGIIAFRNNDVGSDYGPLMAAATIVVAPLAIAFLVAQRWFLEGIAAGSVKQ